MTIYRLSHRPYVRDDGPVPLNLAWRHSLVWRTFFPHVTVESFFVLYDGLLRPAGRGPFAVTHRGRPAVACGRPNGPMWLYPIPRPASWGMFSSQAAHTVYLWGVE